MSFKDLYLKTSYRSFRDDVVNEFYIPVLKEAVLYKRAVGFFSSTALIEISKGISGLIKNGGKIELIVSPILQEEDIDAIQKGYSAKKVVEESLMREFYEPSSLSDVERLNWLAYLVEKNILEIKVAFTIAQGMGLYHEKIGVLYDSEHNMLAFTGSMNETINAFRNNYESFELFSSWNEYERKRVLEKEESFDLLWNDREIKLQVIDFPAVAKEKLLSYRKGEPNWELDKPIIRLEKANTSPHIPNGFDLFNYQETAIENWKNHDYRGIFDMATGTGKTKTGLSAAIKLLNDIRKCGLIIICPYQHLVEQWVEDIVDFGYKPIIGYSASRQKDWKDRLEDEIIDYNLGIVNHFCFVTTVATYCSDFVSKQIEKITGDVLLIADEAHNLGAGKASNYLLEKIKYRLALSATIERYGDEEGTQKLFEYFGEKCIEYPIKRAILEDKLTHYNYYPVVVTLTDDEYDQYKTLTKEIGKCCVIKANNAKGMSDKGKRLLIARSRIVAGAKNKINKLEEVIYPYRNDNNILVYCGSTSIKEDSSDTSEIDKDGERQIDAVSIMLGQKLGMNVRHFTSRETAQEREEIKVRFANSDPYQALVAIKCLDEGVNIPGIRTAFILASCTNPKEYVQRRGRVLRKAPGKTKATIYDFITIPREISEIPFMNDDDRDVDIGLVKREIKRMIEFKNTADNSSEANKLINVLTAAYGLNIYQIMEENFDEQN